MNLIFHTTAAIGIIALVTDTGRAGANNTMKEILRTGLLAFAIGFISHAILDVIPHTYPINPTMDGILGFAFILAVARLTNENYRVISGMALVGIVLPDLIDQWPILLNKSFGFAFPEAEQVLPWHWTEYSGSIYSGESTVSDLNHLFVLVAVALICMIRRNELKTIFGREKLLPQWIYVVE
jgi:hypothetical protein